MTEPSAYQVSLLTPAGVGAIAVVRLEGTAATGVLARHFRRRGAPRGRYVPGHIVFGRFVDGDEVVDEVLAVPIAPRAASDGAVARECQKYDICTHGGLRVVERVISALQASGARFVRAGQGRSHWRTDETPIEREVWQALALARTPRTVRFLIAQRRALPAEFRDLAACAKQDSAAAKARLGVLLTRSEACRFLLNGASIAICGPPNAGKSTLANRLAGYGGSLVSPQAGATLDWVSHETALHGVPVTLIDTVGFPAAAEGMAALAFSRARGRTADADLFLRVFDASVPPPQRGSTWDDERASTLLVLNKSDRGRVWTAEQIAHQGCDATLHVSAALGAGIDRLVGKIIQALGLDWTDETATGLFTERQRRLVRELADVIHRPGQAAELWHELTGRRL